MAATDPFLHENGEPSVELTQIGKSVRNLFPNWIVHTFEDIDSTNTEARRLTLTLGGDAWPRVILADHQSQGRGRVGRAWVAPKESSLLVTIMIPLSQLKVPQTFMPLAVGCWLLEGLERCGAKDVQVKWPNDLLVKGQKIGGILCETAGHALIIGAGINLEHDQLDLPDRKLLAPQATSLHNELGEHYPGRYTSSVTMLSSILENIEHPQPQKRMLQTYRAHCSSLGETISYKDPILGVTSGLAKEIDESGTLLVDVPGSGERRVSVPFAGDE